MLVTIQKVASPLRCRPFSPSPKTELDFKGFIFFPAPSASISLGLSALKAFCSLGCSCLAVFQRSSIVVLFAAKGWGIV